MLHGNDGHLRHLFFDIINSGMQILCNSLQDFQVTAGCGGRTSRAFFLSGMTQGGRSLDLVRRCLIKDQ
jgi:hypothetical protein